MKTLTKNLVYYAIAFTIGTIAFRFGLSHLLEKNSYSFVIIIAVIYFIYNFTIGWFFGKRDYEILPLYDIGLRFHLVTYLLFTIVSFSWFLLDFNAHNEKINSVYITILIWSFTLLVHLVLYLIVRKNAIGGLDKEEIFE
jgi:hypothetical protein